MKYDIHIYIYIYIIFLIFKIKIILHFNIFYLKIYENYIIFKTFYD